MVRVRLAGLILTATVLSSCDSGGPASGEQLAAGSSPVTARDYTTDEQLKDCELGRISSELPSNATVWRSDNAAPVAPLEVRVKGANHYLVKLERAGATVALMLVGPDSVANTRVPLGDYTLKYATGSGDFWCGEDARFPFGVRTSFHKTNDIFAFRGNADGYTGYSVELFLQPSGNLSASQLQPEDW